jgi:hypothetical protein
MSMAQPYRMAASALLWLALGVLAACSSTAPGSPPGRVPDSMVGYNRTFDIALGAMADQKMTISEQDRRSGRIVGELDGQTITTTLQPMQDGTLRVNFVPQSDSADATALVQRLAASYNARMANLSLLGGWRGGGGDRGPVPCPSGPAMCP